jgi:hypothetical protein
MSDYKSAYSDISKNYIEHVVPTSEIDRGRYKRSKDREVKFNKNWSKQKVNLNEVVDYFIPAIEGFIKKRSSGGVKYEFEGKRYIVKCDKVGGYLRIFDKKLHSFCRLDGTPSGNRDETHFKIKRREEM